jgi:hypothetical protein
MSKNLICVCGEEFDNPQKFNSHKSHCKVHYIHKYGSLAEYEAHKASKHMAAGKALQVKAETNKQTALVAWVAEQHKCERCGELMTTKFGSGRFCSRACANTRDHSEETKEKISQALIKPEELKVKRIRPKTKPKTKTRLIKPEDCCLVCGKELKFGHKSQYCQEHLIEHRQEEQINHWLATGETGLGIDSTISPVFRKYIIEQQNGCCAICGIPAEWNGKPLVFVLDHINGDAAYSARDNLRLICPNCDSQLDTFKSKNKNSARTKRKEFLREIREEDK